MIKFNNVDFTYQNAQNGAGVHNITLSIPQGQVVLLCGSSGCGKTTLTRMINGLIPHFYEGEMKGDVTVCGMLTADRDLYEIAPFVGSVFQNPKSQFYTVKTDTEIVFGCENVGMPKKQILSNFENTVKELNISTLLGKSLFSLSGGEKQKIACASVAALFPSIIVMDEPTSNLDMQSISYLKEIIKKWKKSGKTVIIAEHRLYWLMDLADRVIYMDNGYIVQDLLINEFREYSENDLHQMGLRNSIASENSLYRCNERDTGLTFTDFSFSYKNAPHRALDIEKLSIPKGAIVAVLGNNGAGKTTFGRCLCGLEKRCKGTVILENRELTQKQRIALSYIVMQDVNHQLFTESVIDEILLSMEKQPGTLEEKEKRAMEILHLLKLQEFGKPNATDEEVIEAAKKAQCMEFIKKFPEGFKTLAGDCGNQLSGGEKQRITLARAILKNAPIIILDEATAFADTENEAKIEAAISEFVHNKTLIVIAHRLSSIINADQICVLKAGEIIGCGVHEELLENNECYRTLWEAHQKSQGWQLGKGGIL